jgi:predicted phosphodiesterase
MKIAIVSDIHGNLDAFEQVLADMDRQQVDRIISLGDNIGYGPESDSVVKKIQEQNIPSVMGNHELAIIEPKYLNWFNPPAQESLEKTLDLLSDESISFISKLKSHLVSDGCRFVHGFPPDSPLTYLFQVSEARMQKALEELTERLCFIGHTHTLDLISFNSHHLENEHLSKGLHKLDDNKKYIINVGSVGQPRDENNKSKYVIWDASNTILEVRYVPYDIAAVVQKIQNIGLPEVHAQRLW